MKNNYKRIPLLIIALLLAAFSLTQAQTNQYLHYSCSNRDYVYLENGSQYIANKPGFTMAGWFYCDQLSYGQALMGFRGTQGFYMIQLNNGTVECRFQNSAGTLFEYVAPANTVIPQIWQHFAWIYDGTSVKLYVNGILKGSKAANGSFTATNLAFTIGRSILGSLDFYWCGRTDEVSVWSKALTQAEIQDMMANELEGNEAGLELYYKHNQGVPGGDNSSITKLISEVGSPERDGDLINFAMTGETSNFNGTLDPSYQAISFPAIPNKLTNSPPFAIEATATSGLPVQFEILSGPATIDENIITLTGSPGLVEVKATQPGGGQYNAAEPVIQRFHVLDPQLQVPDIDARNPLAGNVYVPTLAQIQLAAISTITFPELFNVAWVKFRIDGQTIDAQNFWNGHYTAWWTPPGYGNYTIEILSANNYGAVGSQNVSISILPSATNVSVEAYKDIWLNPTVTTQTMEAELPSFLGAYDQIIATLNVHCPPGGCGEWDRVAYFEAMDKEGNWVEIIRYITPYGVACIHSIDLTDYMSVLQGKTTFRATCPTLDNGFMYDLTLDYRAGTVPHLYSRVKEAWREIFPFGDYANLQPVPDFQYEFPENTVAAKLKLVSTGHAWGDLNTSNAAEFYNATHDLYVNGTKEFSQVNWLVCNPNPDGCQPQNGTWYHNRAGWCPGAIAPWFNFSLNEFVAASDIELGYTFFEGYVDYCHPNHPNCITGTTCADCNDGFNPVLDVAAYVISFSDSPFIIVENKEEPILQNALSVFPNPSQGVFEIALTNPEQVRNANIIIYDNMSRPVQQMEWNGQTTRIDLSGKAKGLYFLKVIAPGWTELKKIVVN
ncbi:MAG: T9SS type A sorting domain-containing protein [Lentimicrobium sp.]|nr:T9SS type A sorting domain-containing protein [Lentimicrobium sp.]